MGEGNVRQDEAAKARENRCHEESHVFTEAGKPCCCERRLTWLVIDDADVTVTSCNQSGARYAVGFGGDLELSGDYDDSERWRDAR